jgi:hypothetical protein
VLILDADKKRHDEALESHPKYAKNERERKTYKQDAREKKFVLHISTILSNVYIFVYIVKHAVK